MDFKDFISELKNKSDLVSIAGKYLTLERRGGQFWACCPFHHEKTPSFKIDPIGQFYYCFGCKEAGDVVKLVQKLDSLDFIDAAKKLADIAGMEMPKMEGSDENTVKKAERDRLYDLMRTAALYYYSCLMSDSGRTAYEYLQNRGISKATMTAFGMGYAPNSSGLIGFLRSKGYTIDEMKKTGMALEYDSDPYDPFYGRVMIPIINAQGKVVAFGGRTLDREAKQKKYRNSNDNVLFNKKNVLFAFNLVAEQKRERAVEALVVVEGYMDVISLYQAGIKNVVASMGTALTGSQIRQIRNICDNVYMCFDGDSAGRQNTLRVLDGLKAEGLNVKVVSLPDGSDPDDVAREGKDAFLRLLDEALPIYDYKLRTALEGYDLKVSDDKIKYALAAVEIVSELDSSIEREHYLKTVSEITGYSMEHLKRQLDAYLGSKKEGGQLRIELPSEKNASELSRAIKYMLKSGLEGKSVLFEEDVSPCFESEVQRVIYGYLRECELKDKTPRAGDIFGLLDESAHQEAASILNAEAETFGTPQQAAEYLNRCRRKIQSFLLHRERDLLNESLANVAERDEIVAILSKIREIDLKIKGLKGE